MRRNPNTVNLTKDYIESKVSQVAIMSKYLDIPIDVINDCIEHGHLIQSVFRDDDNNNSMGFAFNRKGRLKVRDFGGAGFFEDVYGTVAYVLSLICERRIEPNNKQDFYFILKHIAYSFSDIIDNKEVDTSLDKAISDAIKKGKNKRTNIEVVTRSWNSYDKKYWNDLGVSLGYLNTNFVYPVDQYYINRTVNTDPKYYYSSKDPCYAYLIGTDRKGNTLLKLYFPNRDKAKEMKFITNCNNIEGLLNLELSDYDYILITKSSKDRLSIGCHLYEHPSYGGGDVPLKIGVVNLPSENYHLKDNEYFWLQNKLKPCGKIYSLLDFDRTGRKGAKYLQETYDIPYIFITRGEFGLPNYECKDFADLHSMYSKFEIDNFVKETISYVKQREQSTQIYY